MYFCFICSDAEISAYDKFKLLTKYNIWPIFKRTNHRPKLKINSKVVFYIAGNGVNSQKFVGKATISNIKFIEDHTVIDEQEMINKINKTILENKELNILLKLKDISFFKNNISVKSIMHELNFIKKKSHYGIYFQSGVNVINEEDFNTIIRASEY